MDAEQLLTVAEVASYLRVHEETVRRWIRLGVLAAVKINDGAYRIHVDAVNDLLAGATPTVL